MRTYEATHPWISFSFDLNRANPRFWMLLGEAQSKVDHICGVPLSPAIAQSMHQIYLAKGALATTAIEGNTLSEAEVRARMEGELTLPPSKEYLGVEVDNILAACNDIKHAVLAAERSTIEYHQILQYNLQVLEGLPLDDDVIPGQIRTHSVGVGNYLGAPAEDCEFLLNRMCVWLKEEIRDNRLSAVAIGLIKAILSHIYVAWIHPFGDGNGRTARLIEFHTLLASGVPSAASHLLSNHYNQTRSEYYRQLDRTHSSNGEVLPFLEYALQGFIDGLHEQIALIQAQQLHVHWINYIHELFRDKDSASDLRRRRLAIDLSAEYDPIPISGVRRVSPRIAEYYADKTEKTVRRDISALRDMGLVDVTARGVVSRRELMLGFLAERRRAESA